MADESNTTPNSHLDDPALAVSDVNTAVDPALLGLVDVTNSVEAQVAVRLFLPGMILSGLLVSAASYWEQVAVWLRQTSQEEDLASAELAQAFLRQAEHLRERAAARSERPQTSAQAEPLPHVHLADAVAFVPGQSPLEVGLWRGRLSAVAGWSLGVYSLDED